jgi:hypothetical protein
MATQITEISAKNFDEYLADTVKSAGTIRQRWQLLIIFGLTIAAKTNRDFAPLTKVYGAMRGARGTNHPLAQRYICASLPLVYRDGYTNKNGKDIPAAFLKRKDAGEEFVLIDNGNWWEFSTDGTTKTQTTKPLDVNGRMTKLVDSLTDAWNNSDEVKLSYKELKAQIRKLQELADRIEARDSAKAA